VGRGGTLVGVTNWAARWSAGVLAVALTAAGCSRDEPGSDAERFCGEAAANTALITDFPITNEAEMQAVLDFYRLMGQLAPVAIATEWNTVLHSLETASTVVPGDPESEQRVAMTAYAAEPSAYAVKVWLERNCGVTIPIVTIAPQAQVPARTVPPSTVPGGTGPETSPAP
jgi:hypothetical protein